MRWIAMAALPLLIGAVFVGCGDDDDDETPTAAATTAAATETATSTVTAGETAAGTATVTATGTAAEDGTPAPDGGQTTPFDVKADPEDFAGNITVVDVRTGGHANADRIVFEFDGPALPAARIEYVESAVQCGSGEEVEIKGEAILQVRIDHAVGHTEAGQPTIDEMVDGPGGTIEEAIRICDFEGVVTYAVGTTGEQNFVVTTLKSPTRLVVDVLKD
ncbi:MAG: hypothetical protein M0R74_03760 [Dehalococcoidia bacterium]|nr:hypothetical protein [Dehalococcoidia bacterium]